MPDYRIQFPAKLTPVFQGPARYRGAYGGRGSGKSFNFAKMLAIRGYEKPLRILCCRELQNSIKDSSMGEIINAIQSEPWLDAAYRYGVNYIKGVNGTEFIFRGLRGNPKEIKSLSHVNIAWVEEAEAVSEVSWRNLIPTIRDPGSEIWLTWNPETQESATSKRFLETPPPNSKIVKMNWRDNPWFPPELEAERRHDMQLNPDTYDHIWEGDVLTRSDAQVLSGKWSVEEFKPDPRKWNGPYHGMDFGFANDPTAAVKCWVFDSRLYIEREAVKVKLELDDTAYYVKEQIPGIEEHIIYADSARPESISYLKRFGLPRITACAKWDGSVKDGIQHLRSYQEIVIHPRCPQAIKEAKLYSYKVDKLTGDVLPIVLDAHNHLWDAARYGLGSLIKRRGTNYDALAKM